MTLKIFHVTLAVSFIVLAFGMGYFFDQMIEQEKRNMAYCADWYVQIVYGVQEEIKSSVTIGLTNGTEIRYEYTGQTYPELINELGVSRNEIKYFGTYSIEDFRKGFTNYCIDYMFDFTAKIINESKARLGY